MRAWTLGTGVCFLLCSLIMLKFRIGPSTDLFWMFLMVVGILFVVVELGNFLIEYLNNLHNKL